MSLSVDQERQAPVGEYGSEDAESRKYGSWVTPPTRSAWRESALTRINELAALAG